MKATFTKAIRYFAETVCESPLRTGGSDKKVQTVLCNADHVPFLQGTSLAGAMRSWRNDPELFGDDKGKKSALIVSDLELKDAVPVLRPRLRINGKTGTADNSAKFDVAAVPVGTKGSFQLIWTGDDDPAQIAPRIEEYLSALNSGEIILGALKANGFGRLSLRVTRRMYDLKNPDDLKAWLLGDDVKDTEPITLAKRTEPNVLFTVTATVPSILIKASGSNRGKGGAHAIQIREARQAIIPGSSLKGTIRSQMSRICPHFGRNAVELEQIFGHENRKGGSGIAGVLRFSDGTLTQEKVCRTPRIRINRLTGGTMGTGLFSEETVAAALKCEIRIPASHQAGCALLLYALRDLGLGLYELGSGTSVGRGRVQSLRVHVRYLDREAELSCTGDTVTLTDDKQLVAEWDAALRGGKPL